MKLKENAEIISADLETIGKIDRIVNVKTPPWKSTPYPHRDKPLYYSKIKQNIPDSTIALDEGAQVIDSSDNKLGKIKDVFVEPDSLSLTHVVVSSGIFEKEEKLIPAAWIKDISESSVTLYIDQNMFETLPSIDDDTGSAK